MSLDVKKILNFPQGCIEYIPQFENETMSSKDLDILGGILHDTGHVWHAKGPTLEVRNTKTGSKVGAWVFGGILKDSNTTITCVEEIPRPNGRISLLAVGIDCTISGGIICIFDIFSSKVLRAIQVKEKISYLHVIDPGIKELNLSGPLRNFDGILAAGLDGGDVIIVDVCRQICEESLHSISKRDELNPSQLVILTLRHMPKIEQYKEGCVRDGNHLAIHLNAVFNSTTEHFVLKGPKDDDRIYVNRAEVVTSALYYCSQLTSLLVGYNFGAFQLWDLTTLKLVYTSPICEEHIPITRFALLEPTDDPRAFCYIWVAFGNSELYQMGLPYAVMYSLCYESKEYQEGYGYVYQDFHYCTIRFQIQLGQLEENRTGANAKGGYCLGFQPITKLSTSKESFAHSPAGDTLTLCLISWTVWFSKSEVETCCIVFDLNQWYKEQMPSASNWKDSTNYILRTNITEMIQLSGHKVTNILKVVADDKSITQFMGVQRLEEHFYPTSLSFNLWVLREADVVLMHNQGLQRYLLSQIESAGPLCLIRPQDICQQAISVGLAPLFIDIHPNRGLTTETQREIILNVALEHQLIGWLCKCASEWANGSFSSAGCSLDFIINWAYERADILKTNCDNYCVPLFDYSQIRLDNNANVLLNSCTRQINSLCVLYKHIVSKLWTFVGCLDLVKKHLKGLEMVSVYFEVLQWLVNVGLLPECHPSTYPRPDNSERISAPYFAKELTEYYNERRAQLRILTKETFGNTDSLLFIDNLIEKKCGGRNLLNLWYEDSGTGMYPPPSLQSLIRTYLVTGAGINYKHSLVIYLFLDLAMALDQTWYSSVVTHLIKFPAVFKVSPSVIKITQAFWQLDHGDFTTAMEQLLDPFVLGEDLQPWHHNIAMRSLLLHKQPNFALLYMQIRKPPITDEHDVLTAISLFIANNMLDEAFYFKKQHQNKNEENLLTHLFNECRKNDALHLILYKCLNTDEEKAFFDYLKAIKNPTSDDLQIFYYLLRSRFIEAFDTHSNVRRRCPEKQGLIGQSMASKTDQIVKIFKTLLPDVNKNLVEYIRRERTNLWKEVKRPTPMSVFVHDASEQVKYKSTLIHAALAKAKRTFPESIAVDDCRDLKTEETPFLRTPTICRNGKRAFTPVITPKIIDMDDEDSASASKRIRISPRSEIKNPQSPIKRVDMPFTLTPIVKRKTSLQRDLSSSYDNLNLCTPQSILKVRHLVQKRDSVSDDTLQNEDKVSENHGGRLLENTSLRLESRSSLPRTPKRQHVQFDEATQFTTSVSDESKLESSSVGNRSNLRSSMSSKDISSILSSSVHDELSDDVFYSPNNSGNSNIDEKADEEEIETVHTETDQRRVSVDSEESVEEKKEQPEKETDILKGISTPEIKVTSASPRARRSYKRSVELTPTRSSPRLSKLQVTQKDPSISESQTQKEIEADTTSDELLSPRPTRAGSKLKGRKSLSRQVLENNTFSKIYSPSTKENIVSEERSYFKSERTSITEKSLIESKTTTMETNTSVVETEEKASPFKVISDTLKTHTSSSSVTKTQNLEKELDSDSSLGSDLSYRYEEQEPSMKLSDSLQEYIDFLMASGKKLRESEHLKKDKIELSQTQLTFDSDKEVITEDEEITSDGESEQLKQTENLSRSQLNFDNDKREITEDDDYSSDDDVVETRERMPEIRQFKDRSESPKSQLRSDKDKEESGEDVEVISSDDEIQKNIEPSEKITYQDLHPLNEGFYDDIEQKNTDIPESSDTTLYVPKKLYAEQSSGESECFDEQERTYNELEANIFGYTGFEDTVFRKSNRSGTFTDETTAVKEEEIVLISSDSENDKDSNSRSSYNSAYTKSTEKCPEDYTSSDASQGTDGNNINIHYEVQEDVNDEDSNEKEENRVTIEEQEDNDFDQIDENEDDQVNKGCLMIVEEVESNSAENLEECNTQSSFTEIVDTEEIEQVEIPINETSHIDPLSNIGNEEADNETKSVFEMNVYNENESSNQDPMLNTETSNILGHDSESDESINKEINEFLEELEKPDQIIVNETTKLLDNIAKENVLIEKSKENQDVEINPLTDEEDNNVTEEDPGEINEPSTVVVPQKSKSKIDQSTNTTFVTKGKTFSISKKKEENIDQFTNASKLESGKSKNTSKKTKKSEKKTNVQTDTAIALPNIFDDVDSEFAKIIGDDPFVSSDTTEAAAFRTETVVADIHAPSTPGDRSQKTPSRRVTRRSSAAHSPSRDIDISTDVDHGKLLFVDIKNDDFSKLIDSALNPQIHTTPARRMRRSLSALEANTSLLNTSNSDNVNIDCDNDQSLKIINDSALVALTLRRKRSASVDVKTFSKPRTTKRTKSVDSMGEIINERKTKSIAHMPIISEEKVKETRKSKSVVDSYTTARRLTRRQASMVKDLTITTDAESVDDMPKLQIDLEPIDPIILLEKDHFEGKPDPEENIVYEQSSPSTSTVSVPRSRRRSRSNSVLSEASTPPSHNLPDTPQKRKTRSRTKSPAASVSGISTRSRKQSESDLVVSEQPEQSTPPKRGRSKKTDDIEGTGRRTRSRTGSASSIKSDGSAKKKAARGRRIVSAKSELPEISEEKESVNKK
ncbi:uncharacterized protein Elys isoform X1 [Diabrotica undecimpunctata]|uniref:uncharacterized protein Elys isoform X1 n=1 Tax=Diabrotica undecimpunctata TaxID=50387 RepID=UPI003B63B27A